MKVSFHGAVGEVTGSCTLLEANGQKILVDCGLFQGGNFAESKNFEDFSFDPKEISAVILTHAHLDHVGRLPKLIKGGFTGLIYTTPPTAELAGLILEDAFEIMEYNHRKFGTPLLYRLEDVNEIASRMKTFHLEDAFELGRGLLKKNKISVVFHEAGHIFGSAFVEIKAECKKLIFSGDIGNVNVPILYNTAELPEDVDFLLCESTYGNRLHPNSLDRKAVIEIKVREAMNRGGSLLIPAFSIERTQELLYTLNELIDVQGKFKNIPIFLDSPLSIRATRVFERYTQYYNDEAYKYLNADQNIFDFSNLTLCETRNDSKKINAVRGKKVIIAGAGMMNGGRILHHALRYLTDIQSTLLFVGYQAPGTLGRRILTGESPVHIMGERLPVKC
ncbi:MAG: MBL fold metallo-hydrolase, partial [Candidatus Magasanikbacteria bacterium]|nr:MBL fold metallo-hydrolase [Candidatus Magasanikbacteria bacterium]